MIYYATKRLRPAAAAVRSGFGRTPWAAGRLYEHFGWIGRGGRRDGSQHGIGR